MKRLTGSKECQRMRRNCAARCERWWEQKNDVSSETVAALNALAQRIDTRLGEVQTNVQSMRADVDALQARLDKRKSRLLFVFNLTAALSTLMLAWIVYTQVIVIRHHWARVRRPAGTDAGWGANARTQARSEAHRTEVESRLERTTLREWTSKELVHNRQAKARLIGSRGMFASIRFSKRRNQHVFVAQA